MLIAEVARGGEAALEELLQRYQRPLSAFLWRQTGGRDVEDLYQETWLRVVRHAARFDPERRFSTWLFQIGVNLCRDWHRRRPLEPAEITVEPGHAGESVRTEAGIDAERLLASLSVEHREVVVLRYYHDLSENDVSRILEIPKGTVKSRMHNALKKLSALVAAEGVG